MMAFPSESGPVAADTRALDRIADALERSLERVAEAPPATAPPAADARSPLQGLDDRLARLQARLDQAERNAADADAMLNAEAEAFRVWIEAMTAARARLANWVAAK